LTVGELSHTHHNPSVDCQIDGCDSKLSAISDVTLASDINL